MKVLIVEDDLIAYDIADTFLRQNGYNSIDHSTQVEKARALLRKNKYDIILLDIHLEDGKGTELIEHVPSGTNIIFMTSDPAYAVEAFEVNAVDYLLKPIKEDRFVAALKKIEGDDGNNAIVIKADLQYHKILTSSILYVKSNKDYLTLYAKEKSYTFFGRIKNFIETLPQDEFMQCHRSYLINLSNATSYSLTSVMIGDIEVPVSNRYKKEIAQRFLEKNTA